MARRSTIRSGTTKSLIYAVLCIVLGIGFLIGGKVTWSNPADCGGQTMQQGDTCEVTDHGETTDRSLSDQEASNHREAMVLFVLGPLMIIGGGFWLSSEIRIRKRRGATAANGPTALAGAGPFPGNGSFAAPFSPAQGQYNGAPQQFPAQNPYTSAAAPQPPQQQAWPGQQPQQPPQFPQQPYPQQPPQQPYPQQYQQQPPQQPGGWSGS